MQFTLVLHLFDFNLPEKYEPMHIFSSREKNIKQDRLSLNIPINGKFNSHSWRHLNFRLSVCILFIVINPAMFFPVKNTR